MNGLDRAAFALIGVLSLFPVAATYWPAFGRLAERALMTVAPPLFLVVGVAALAAACFLGRRRR